MFHATADSEVHNSIEIQTDILIVGGGGAGLALALTCEKYNLPYVLVEREKEIPYSKATGLHASSMEYFHELGLSEIILQHGVRLDKSVTFQEGSLKRTVHFRCGESAHAINVSLSQKKLESFIVQRLNPDRILYGHTFSDYTMQESGSYVSKIIDSNSK